MKLEIGSTSVDLIVTQCCLSLAGCRVFLCKVGAIWWHRCQSSESRRRRRRMFYSFR